MSTRCQNIFLSESSVISGYLSETNTESVGKNNPVNLQLFSIDKIKETIGKKITNGDIGTIYEVKGCNSPRVYKVIPQDKFEDGNEIVISKIASEVGIAPTFYSAFLVDQNSKRYVVIEMDDAGKSLGKWMEALAENSETNDEKESSVKANPLTKEEKDFQERLKEIKAKMETKYGNITVIETPRKNRLKLEEAVDKMYPTREVFYYELFSKIKILAENKISYGDSHVGNIMPNREAKKGLQLIDFDGAHIMVDTKTAVLQSAASVYNRVHFDNFRKLPNLSANSLELIEWFKSRLV